MPYRYQLGSCELSQFPSLSGIPKLSESICRLRSSSYRQTTAKSPVVFSDGINERGGRQPGNRHRTDGGDGVIERITEPLDHTAVEWERRLPMNQVTFSIPDEILLALKATPEILAARIRIAAAVKLYEMGQLSSGAASQLAGVPKPYFLGHLADYGVNTFDLSEEELSHDLKSA